MDISGKSSTTDEIRMRNHRALQEQRHENEIRDLQARQGDELRNVIEEHALRSEKMRQDYDVQISREAEKLEQQLARVREDGESRIEQEKASLELELSRLKNSYQQKTEDYRKNAEEKLDRVRKELQQSTQSLYEQARASQRAATQAANQKEKRS